MLLTPLKTFHESLAARIRANRFRHRNRSQNRRPINTFEQLEDRTLLAVSVTLLGSGLVASNGALQALHTSYRGDFQGDVTADLEPGTYTVSTQAQFIPYGTFTVGVDATGNDAVMATTGALVELSPNQVSFDLSQLFAVTVFGDEIQATREFQGTMVSFHQPAILTGIGHINRGSLKGNTTFYVPDGTYSVRTENSGTIGGRGTYGTFTVEDNGAGTSLLSGTTGAFAATGGDVHFDLSKLAEITVLGTDLITPAGRAQQVILGTFGPVNRGSAKGDLTIHAPAGTYVISSGVPGADAYGQFTVGDDGSGNLTVTETTASATLTGSALGFDLSQLNQVEVAAVNPGSLPKTMVWAIDEVVGGGRTDDTLALPNGTYRFRILPRDGSSDLIGEFSVDAGGLSATLFPAIDPLFQLTLITNQAPGITSAAAVNVAENQTAAIDVQSSDPDGETENGGGLIYSLTGGADEDLFSIDPDTGVLTFNAAPDFETPGDDGGDNVYDVQVTVSDADGLSNAQDIAVSVINQASIIGTVFVDVDEDGLFDANEPGIDGVAIELLDETGTEVLETVFSSDGGMFLFEDLDPATYRLRELQLSGVQDGAERLGSLGGVIVTNDTMQLTLDRIDASDYVFAEVGLQVTSGDTATIGFWQNKHGQALIDAGGAGLANWLSTNFANVFGNVFDGKSVADFYKQELFKQKSAKSSGPAKVDAQFMATAMATYFTSSHLAGNVAAGYGFNVSHTGIGTRIVNVGSSGAAFGVANGTNLTIMQLLLATNALTDVPDNLMGSANIYDTNGDGVIDATEADLRAKANLIYSAINEGGEI